MSDGFMPLILAAWPIFTGLISFSFSLDSLESEENLITKGKSIKHFLVFVHVDLFVKVEKS